MTNLKAKIKKYIKTKSAGLQIICLDDNKFGFHLVILEKTGDQINVSFQDSYTDIRQVIKNLTSSIPVSIGIEGKETLIRQIDITDSDEPLLSVLPNASSKDFIVQATYSHWDSPVVSIIRRSVLENILELLNRNKLYPFSISIGISSMGIIAELLSSYNKISTPYYTLCIQNGIFSGLSKKNNGSNEYNLNGQVLSGEFLLPFSLAVNNFINDSSFQLTDTVASVQKKEFIYRKKTKFISLIYMAAVFLVLLANFIVYSSLKNKYEIMNYHLAANSQTVGRIKEMKKLISEKQILLGSDSGTGIELYSYYADRIAHSMIKGIRLKKILLSPQPDNIRPQGKNMPDYKSDCILIEGQSNGSTQINDWITVLNEYSWIKKIRVVSYREEQEARSAIFVLELNLENNE